MIDVMNVELFDEHHAIFRELSLFKIKNHLQRRVGKSILHMMEKYTQPAKTLSL